VKNEKSIVGFKEFAMENQVFIRPIGKMIYLMPSYRIKKNELLTILEIMKRWFEK
jgi:adenosylmethionine-8-amino-7-oxononanoate aminotransferase